MKLLGVNLKGLLSNYQDIWLLPGAECLCAVLWSSTKNRQKSFNYLLRASHTLWEVEAGVAGGGDHILLSDITSPSHLRNSALQMIPGLL